MDELKRANSAAVNRRSYGLGIVVTHDAVSLLYSTWSSMTARALARKSPHEKRGRWSSP
jgi:hypothetical protein